MILFRYALGLSEGATMRISRDVSKESTFNDDVDSDGADDS
jgi:hypothetical protein